MVLKGTGVRGDEQIGTEEVASNVVRTAVSIGEALLKFKKRPKKDLEDEQIPPQIKGDFRADLYKAFLDKGVPEDIASEAADDVMLNRDASESPAIASAHKIVEEGQFKQQSKANSSVKQPGEGTAVGESSVVDEPKIESKVETAQPSSQSQSEKKNQPTQALKTTKPATSVVKTAETSPRDEDISPDKTASKKVQISQPPSEMTWNKLQQTAKEINAETGNNPDGRKRKDVQSFVENYQDAQRKEQSTKTTPGQKSEEASVVATPPVIRTPVSSPAEPSLEKAYNDGLKAAAVDSKTSASAAKAIVSGKGADQSAAIRDAHAQVTIKEQRAQPAVQRSTLHQLYYDVLAKQGIKTELAEAASKDLANGKGAMSSPAVRAAHKTILDKELLSTGGPTPAHKNWQKHSRYVAERDPRKRDQAVALQAARAGMPANRIEKMIRMNSPVAGRIHKQQGGNAVVGYTQPLAAEVTRIAQRTAKTLNRGKQTAISKSKGGIEI